MKLQIWRKEVDFSCVASGFNSALERDSVEMKTAWHADLTECCSLNIAVRSQG